MTQRVLTTLAAMGGAMALAACPPQFDESADMGPSQGELIGQGQVMAEMMCSSCHAIGFDDEGAHPDTVPFREFSWRYPIETLAEPLAEGIIVGHPDMPEFQFEPKDIDALLAYIESVQAPRPT